MATAARGTPAFGFRAGRGHSAAMHRTLPARVVRCHAGRMRRDPLVRAAPVVAGSLLLAVLGGCSRPAEAACRGDVRVGVLPEWASTGFTPGAEVPYVMGERQRILAVPFSQPLVAVAEDAAPQNKVLLVPREPPQGPAPVTIVARLAGTDEVVTRTRRDGPGPGTLDLPKPGCWRLTLTWADDSDTLDLQYVAGPSATATD